MTPTELQQWLSQHTDAIFGFMDYETTIESEESLNETLGHWFGSARWGADGDRFVPLGMDGTGGLFAVWIRPDAQGPPPVVFLGSEGGRGVLASTCERWAQVIAHAPGIIEYPNEGERCLFDEGQLAWIEEDGEPEELAQAQAAHARYRDAVVARFGPLPTLAEFRADLGELDAAWAAWVDARIDH